MSRHTHRWVPSYGGYQCHCGKSRTSAPVNYRDVAARKQMARESRAATAAQVQALREQITLLELRRETQPSSWTPALALELSDAKDTFAMLSGREWK